MGVRVGVLIALVQLAGCSFLFVEGPRHADVQPQPNTPSVYPDCTDSKTIPYLDIAIAIASTSVLITPSYGGGPGTEEVVFMLGTGALFTASSFIGLRRVDACRQARIRYVSALQQQPVFIQGPPGSVP